MAAMALPLRAIDYTYTFNSEPAGYVNQSGIAAAGSTVTTPALQGEVSGWVFSYWKIDDQRQADASGVAVPSATFTLNAPVTATAVYFRTTDDTDGDTVPDWYEWQQFGSLAQTAGGDFDADGISHAVESWRGYSPRLPDTIADGGIAARRSRAMLFVPSGQSVYTINSEPAGYVSESGVGAIGTVVRTPTLQGENSGWSFSYWKVNGMGQADVNGVAVPSATFTLAGPTTATAVYLRSTEDTDADGVADWYEWQQFGSLVQTAAGDVDGDGISHAIESWRGYSPRLVDTIADGGIAARRSVRLQFVKTGDISYAINSEPTGFIDQAGVGTSGTTITTSALYGEVSGWTFSYWRVNGSRQADANGVATPAASFSLAGPTTATAVYLRTADDTDADGVADWYEWKFFGGLTQSAATDADGDGLNDGVEAWRGYNPRMVDTIADGGVAVRRSRALLYQASLVPAAPVIKTPPQSQTVALGTQVTFMVVADGNPAPVYQWRKNTVAIPGATNAAMTIANVQSSDAGDYTVFVSNGVGTPATSDVATLTVIAVPTIASVTPSLASPGSSVVITGTSLTGATSVKFNGLEATSFTVNSYTQITAVIPLMATTGPISVTNAIGTGTSADNLSITQGRGLTSLSSRVDVGVGNQAAVASFTVEGAVAKNILIRGVGPGLTQFGVPGVLADPMLSVHDATGAQIAANDDWGSTVTAPTIASTTASLAVFPLVDGSTDAVILRTFAPGTYSVRLYGKDATTGQGAIEVHDADTNLRVSYVAAQSQVNGSMTTGFVLGGSAPQTVLIRAVTNSLAGVAPLADNPTLSVFNASNALIASNDHWVTFPDQSGLASATTVVGAAPLFPGNNDAALLLILPAGAYTAQVGGFGGLAQCEIFVVDGYRPAMQAPALTSPFIVQTCGVGGTVSFGAPWIAKPNAVSFQWRKDGVAIAAATTSWLSLASATAGDSGSYSVVLTNDAGTTTSAPATLTVNKFSQTISFDPLPSRTYGDAPFALYASASSSLPVAFTSSNPSVATLSGNTVTIVGAGTAIITASQPGDMTYQAASDVPQTLTVNKAPQWITFDALPGRLVGDGPFVLTAASNSNLPIAYASSNTAVATVSGNTVTIVGPGTTTITASQGGDANYLSAIDVTQPLTVSAVATVPEITAHPAPQTITVGSNATFAVTAAGAPLSYAWHVSTDAGTIWTALASGGAYGDVSSSTLVITAPPESFSGYRYRCVVWNTAGSVISEPAALTVNALQAPSVTTHPAPQTINVGTNATFAVAATGTAPLGYAWQCSTDGGGSWPYLSSGGAYGDVNSPTLVVTAPPSSFSGYLYRCVVSNVAGTVFSEPAALTIVAGNVAPTVASFSPTSASGGTTLTITGSNFSGVSSVKVNGLEATGFIVDSDSQITTTVPLLATSGVISVTSMYGVGNSATALSIPPSRGLLNQSARLDVGGANGPGIANFSVEGTVPKTMLIRGVGPALASFGVPGVLADPVLTIYDGSGAEITSNDNWGSTATAPAVVSATTSVGAFALSDGSADAAVLRPFAPGTYSIRVSGKNSAAGVALIEVYEASADSRLVHVAATGAAGAGMVTGFVLPGPEPQTVLVRAISTSFDPYITLYQNDATYIASNANWMWNSNLVDIATATATAGAVPLAEASTDAALLLTLPPGRYTAQVTGGAGTARCEIFVVDGYRASSFAPALMSPIEDRGVDPGASTTFAAAYVAKPGLTSAQWRKNGADIAGATNTTYTIPSVTAADAGTYSVSLTNPAGSIVSTPAALTVNTAPAITAPPQSQVANVGATVTFSVTASGSPAPTYQWNLNGLPIPGATSASLTINNAQLLNAGSYTVTVANSVGSQTSAPALLSGPNAAPSITTQPANTTVTSGQPATLSVAAVGAGTLSYQWRRNGVPLADATNPSLTLPAATRLDADYYDVFVGDGLSVSNSSTVRLSVAPTSYPTLMLPDPAWNVQPERPGGSAYTTLPLPDGRFYVAGSFVSANGVRSPMIVRGNPDGSLDPTFIAPEIYGTVWALAVQSDGKVIIGGDFQRINGATHNRIARLLPGGALDTAFAAGSGASSTVYALSVQTDDRIVVGGAFSSFDEVEVNYLTRLTAAGALDTTFNTDGAGANGVVYALARQNDGNLLAAGGFTTLNDVTVNRVARLTSSGQVDAMFNPGGAGANSTVYALAPVADGGVYIGGSFSAYNDVTAIRMARLRSDGTPDDTFSVGSIGFNNNVRAIAVQLDGKTVVGGTFTSFNYQSRRIVRLMQDGSADSEFTPSVGDSVYAVSIQPSGHVLIGGTMAWPHNAFVRIDSSAPFAASGLGIRTGDGTVAVALPQLGGKLVIAGTFDRLRGTAVAGNIARCNADGTLDLTFNAGGTGASGSIAAAARLSDGRIAISGWFTSYNGTPRSGLAVLKPDGALDAGFSPPAELGVYGNVLAALRGGRILVAGSISHPSLGGWRSLVVFNGDGSISSGFNAPVPINGSINCVAVQADDKVLVGGSFTTVGSANYNRLVRLNGDGSIDTTFNPGSGASSTVYALSLEPSGRFFIGGSFSTYNNSSRSGVARIQPSGALDSYSPASSISVYGVLVQEDGKPIVRGTFSAAGGVANTAYLARLNTNGAVDSTFVGADFASSEGNTFLAMRDDGQLITSNPRSGLLVTRPASLPTIATQPVAQTAPPGGSATFSASATSSEQVSYQWLLDGMAIPGATNPTYTITNAQLANVGTYSVVVSNQLGSVTSIGATLSGPNPAPVIVTQPQDLVATAGQPATFTASATGVGSLTYQWRRNGVPVTGATAATYTLSSTTRGDADYYDLAVYDGLSVATTKVARLSVAPIAYSNVVTPDPAWDLRAETDNPAIFAILPLADGRFYAAGNLTSVGGARTPRVFRANADGTRDVSFVAPEINANVRALAVQTDGRLLIGGDFTHVAGSSRRYLARLNSDGSLDGTFDCGTGPSGTVYAVALQSNGRIVVGGAFTTINGITANYIARLNPDGTRDVDFNAGGTGASGSVYALLIDPDERIVIGGAFTAYNSAARGRLARLLSSGALDPSFAATPGASSSVRALARQPDGSLLVGGDFTQYNGTNIGRLARVSASGTLDTSFLVGSSGFSSTVYSVCVWLDGTIAVGGGFSSFNGSWTGYLTNLSTAGARLGTPPASSSVYALAVHSDGRLLVGGTFSSVGGEIRRGLAGLTVNRTVDPAVDFALRGAGQIHSLLPLPGGKVFAAGYFHYLRGVPASSVVRLNGDGSIDPSFNPGTGPNSTVYGTGALPDGRIALTGNFSSYDGGLRGRLAVIRPDGTLDTSFKPAGTGLSGTGYAVAVLPRGRILVAGSFTTASGVARNRVAVYNPDGSLSTAFDSGTNVGGTVYVAVAQSDAKILLGGAFSSRIMRLHPNGSRDTSFSSGLTGANTVYALALQADGKVVVGGSFSADPLNLVARLNSNGTADMAFQPGAAFADGVVYAVMAQENGNIVAHGSFSSMGGTADSAYLTRLTANGPRDVTFSASEMPAATSAPAALVMRDNGQIALANGGDRLVVTQSVAMAPLITTQPVAQTVVLGGAVSFSVVATGSPAPAYQWFKDDTPISGATTATYTIGSVQASDEGTYSVSAANSEGSITSVGAALMVNLPPTITIQPAGVTVSLGGSATLTVSATGTMPLTYEWSRDGAVLSTGPSSSLSLINVQQADAGSYTVKVTNVAGSTTSEPAVVSIIPAPIVTTLSATAVRPGATLTIAGSNFVGVTAVRFGGLTGVTGAFTVNSPTQITVTVPAGAVSGPIVVESPNGSAMSTVSLAVAPDFALRNPRTTAASFERGIAHGNGTTVLASAAGELWSSNDGIGWTRRHAGATPFRGLAYVGGLFIAGGDRGTLLTSVDGITWTPRTISSSLDITGVAYDGARWIAVCDTPTVHSSLDGMTWTPASGPAAEAVTFGAGLFVAVGSGGSIQTSPDGAVWASVTSPTASNLNDVQFAGGRFVAVGAGGSILTSVDGVAWTGQTHVSGATLYSVAYGSGKYVIGTSTSANVLISTDGATNWTSKSTGQGLARSIVFTGAQFIAGGATGSILTSPDANTWTPRQTVTARTIRDVVYADGRFIAVGGTALYMTSVDGVEWTYGQNAAGSSAALVGIAYGAGRFVAIGANTILTSADGVVWTNTSPAGTFTLNGVGYGGGAFVAVGAGGVAYLSIDGTAWQAVSTGTASDLASVAYGPPGFRAAAAGGMILGSTDGVSWTPRTTPVSTGLNAVRYLNNGFVAAGDAAVILTSSDGDTWTKRTVPTVAGNLTSVSFGDGTYVAVSATTTTSYYTSPDSVTWTRRTPVAGTYTAAGDPAVAYGNGRFVVVANNGFIASSNPAPDTFHIATQPAGVALSPGQSVTLSVAAAGADASYQWYSGMSGDTSAPIAGATSASFTTPAITGARDFWVRVSGGGTTIDSATAAVRLNVGAPTIASLSATHVRPGSAVTVTGTGFHDVTSVRLGGAAGPVVNHTVNSPTSITVGVPIDAMSGPVVVQTLYGTVASAVSLTIAPDFQLRNPQTTALPLDAGVAFGNGVHVSIGVSGQIWSSVDGMLWTRRYYGTTALNGVAFAAGRFVAVGASGTILTSTDGAAWMPRPVSTTAALTGVAHSGTQWLVLAAGGGTAVTSNDGLTWTATTLSAGAGSSQDVVFGAGLFVSVGNAGNIRTSPDGSTWTPQASGVGATLLDVFYTNNLFVAVGNAGTIVTSTNGVAWSVKTSGTSGALYSTAYGAGKFVVGGGGTSITSSDGITWSVTSLPEGNVRAVVYNGARFVGTGSVGSIVTSLDGITWTTHQRQVTGGFRDIAYGNGRFVAVAGTATSVYATSPDGLNWTGGRDAAGVSAALNGVTYGNGLFVAVGPAILTTPDGTAWTNRTPPSAPVLEAVAHGNSAFVAVGAGGAAFRSADGLSWTAQATGEIETLHGITFGAGVFAAVGDAGRVLTSPDGVVWSIRSSPTSNALDSVRYLGGKFVAVGASGTVLTSADGITWAVRSFPEPSADLTSVAYGDGYYIT